MIRTQDLLLRRQLLYPAELRDLNFENDVLPKLLVFSVIKKGSQQCRFTAYGLLPFCLLSVRQDSNGSGRPSATLWSQTKCATYLSYFNHVGETGFEPATLWSQTRCATGLRHSPRLSLSTLRKSILRTFRNRVEEAGFEPAVPLRVRQFSKLLVSATHPSLRSSVVLGCKYSGFVFRKANISRKKLRQKLEMPIFGKV